ncbi:hypothetical protein ACFLXB_09065 [Chloroflexota bacterium]
MTTKPKPPKDFDYELNGFRVLSESGLTDNQLLDEGILTEKELARMKKRLREYDEKKNKLKVELPDKDDQMIGFDDELHFAMFDLQSDKFERILAEKEKGNKKFLPDQRKAPEGTCEGGDGIDGSFEGEDMYDEVDILWRRKIRDLLDKKIIELNDGSAIVRVLPEDEEIEQAALDGIRKAVEIRALPDNKRAAILAEQVRKYGLKGDKGE